MERGRGCDCLGRVQRLGHSLSGSFNLTVDQIVFPWRSGQRLPALMGKRRIRCRLPSRTRTFLSQGRIDNLKILACFKTSSVKYDVEPGTEKEHQRKHW